MKVESQAEVDQLVAALGRGLNRTLDEVSHPVERLVFINNIGPTGWLINEDRLVKGTRVDTREEARRIVSDHIADEKGSAGYYSIINGDDTYQVHCGYQIVFPQ